MWIKNCVLRIGDTDGGGGILNIQRQIRDLREGAARGSAFQHAMNLSKVNRVGPELGVQQIQRLG